MDYRTIEFNNSFLRLIDQRKLPLEKDFYEARNYQDVVYAISEMVVRGAPAIGATAAYGYYLAALKYKDMNKENFILNMKKAKEKLAAARPTAVNLVWALERMDKVITENPEEELSDIIKKLKKEADDIYREDIEINHQMAKHGNKIIPQKANILTHCNTGALATVDYGTALGVIREAHNQGKEIHVYADETRPRLQGSRLTAFELVEEGIPATLIVDSVAATLIRDGKIDVILVGADRIAVNGDTANKIGTYMLSEIASQYGIPFYVVAPTSTIDYNLENGDMIEIEERDLREVTHIQGVRVAPEGIDVYNPAFDVTPATNISAIITEKGIISSPLKEGLAAIKGPDV